MRDEAARAYEALHWGTPPFQTEDILVLDHQKGVPVAECIACSYVTVKDDKPAIWRHDFKQFDGRGPYLLEVPERRTKAATVYTPRVRRPKDVIALGRLIDLEIRFLDGPDDIFTVYTPFLWVCTTTECLTKQGGPTLFGSRFEVPYAIENRQGCPYVTERGIID